jgi:hypothetical protein
MRPLARAHLPGCSISLIAAFADFMKVDYIISENRHFYGDLKATVFIILTARSFLDLIEE